MLAVIVILVGVALEIVKANGWFIVPDIAIYIVFVIGGLLALVNIINWLSARRLINNTRNRIR